MIRSRLQHMLRLLNVHDGLVNYFVSDGKNLISNFRFQERRLNENKPTSLSRWLRLILMRGGESLQIV